MSWSEAVSLCESLGSKLQTFTSTQLVNDTMRFGNNEGSTVWIRKMHDDWLSGRVMFLSAPLLYVFLLFTFSVNSYHDYR